MESLECTANRRDSLADVLGPWVKNARRELDVAAQLGLRRLNARHGIGSRKPKKGAKTLQTVADKLFEVQRPKQTKAHERSNCR